MAARAQRTRRYFYGPDNSLEPVVVRLRYSEVSVFKVAPGVRAPSTALPIGARTTAPTSCVLSAAHGAGLDVQPGVCSGGTRGDAV